MTSEQRRALQLLAGTSRGVSEAEILTRGFTREMPEIPEVELPKNS